MIRVEASAITLMLLLALAGPVSSAEPAPAAGAAGLEFFEKRVRPVLADNCYQCHGEKEQKGGLRLDRRSAILDGGESGPAILPGDPDNSLLIKAVRQLDQDLQMPKKGKLKDAQIADLVAWVKMGAPAPRRDDLKAIAPSPGGDYNLAERRKHWAYQPVQSVTLPLVKDRAWCNSPIDAFILAKLEAAGLSPAPPADKRSLIRRMTFDLIGLPPTAEEVDAFLADDAADAYEKVVNRLLASPHYGERWARHWLDLVRFSETMGYEFDFEVFNAWRYRDYVIRAFNADLPYDQFAVEHLAGDLLSPPRRHSTEGFNESVLATGFFSFGEGKQTPIDVRQEQADRIDNQIDVLTKAFLGQTVACARCHDHKFDAISTKDYYALVGYLRSSRHQQAFIDPPDRITAKAEQLAVLKEKIRTAAMATVCHDEVIARMDRYLLAARQVLGNRPETRKSLEEAAKDMDLDAARLGQWVKALQQKEVGNAAHPLHAWIQLAAIGDPQEFAQRRQALRTALQDQMDLSQKVAERSIVFEDFRKPSYDGWYVTGDAFRSGPSRAGDVMIGDSPAKPIARFVPAGGAHSGMLTDRLEGELRSRTFTIDKKYIHFLMAGRGCRINVVIDGYLLLMKPLYGGLTVEAKDETLAWQVIDVGLWKGHRAHIEIIDSTLPIITNPPPPDHINKRLAPGYIQVDQIRFSDDGALPPAPNRLNLEVLRGEKDVEVEALARRYQTLANDECRRWQSGDADDIHSDGAALMNWLLHNGLLDGQLKTKEKSGSAVAALLEEYHRLEATIPDPMRAPALADGTGEDEFVFIRGNHTTPGEKAPRRLLEVLAGPDQPVPKQGSGRLELARRLADASNPLFARVMVNRIWKHHFDEGIVRTPDDFGRMGQPPTHPELLDYLATYFMVNQSEPTASATGGNAWSIKKLHRLMVLSNAYRMSSRSDPKVELLDPENKLLHRMPVRRLEAEAIRDAILLVSGRLDRRMYGPSVVPFVMPFMEGRGRPKSGPLDGDGRRAIYINARRNFLTPMLLAFDYPISFTTVGRRAVSNVPGQALTLMNDPFIVLHAQRWSEQILSDKEKSLDQRIRDIYLAAFARPPTDDELRDVRLFLEKQGKQYGTGPDDPKAWADLCHVMINVKEFIFIN